MDSPVAGFVWRPREEKPLTVGRLRELLADFPAEAEVWVEREWGSTPAEGIEVREDGAVIIDRYDVPYSRPDGTLIT